MGKSSFLLYDSDMKNLDYLTDNQIGKLFRAIAKYRFTGEKSDLGSNPALNMLCNQIIDHISINEEKYKELCAKRTAAANKRWVKPQDKSMHMHTNACTSIQTDANGCIYDNDIDNEYDNVIDNDNVNESVACGAKKENKKNNYYKRKNNIPALLRDEPSYDIDAFMQKALHLKYKSPETTPSSESG